MLVIPRFMRDTITRYFPDHHSTGLESRIPENVPPVFRLLDLKTGF